MVGGSISQRSSDRIRVELFGTYTFHTNVSKDLTLAGMAGVVSLTSSVDMDRGDFKMVLKNLLNEWHHAVPESAYFKVPEMLKTFRMYPISRFVYVLHWLATRLYKAKKTQ